MNGHEIRRSPCRIPNSRRGGGPRRGGDRRGAEPLRGAARCRRRTRPAVGGGVPGPAGRGGRGHVGERAAADRDRVPGLRRAVHHASTAATRPPPDRSGACRRGTRNSTPHCGPASRREPRRPAGQPWLILAVVVVVLVVTLVAWAWWPPTWPTPTPAAAVTVWSRGSVPSPLRNCSSSSAISSPLGQVGGRIRAGCPPRSRWPPRAADHVEVFGVGADELVDLVPGRLAGRPQFDGVEHGARHRAQPLDERGAGLGIGHGRNVVGDPCPQADEPYPGLAEGDLEGGLDSGRDLEGPRAPCRSGGPGRPTRAARSRPGAPGGCGGWAPGRRRGRPPRGRPRRETMPTTARMKVGQEKSGSGPVR